MELLDSVVALQHLGFQICCTPGTAEYYARHGISSIVTLQKPAIGVSYNSYSCRVDTDQLSPSSADRKGSLPPPQSPRQLSGHPPPLLIPLSSATVLDWIQTGEIQLIVNIPEGTTRSDEVTAGYLIRRAAVDNGLSLITNAK